MSSRCALSYKPTLGSKAPPFTTTGHRSCLGWVEGFCRASHLANRHAASSGHPDHIQPGWVSKACGALAVAMNTPTAHIHSFIIRWQLSPSVGNPSHSLTAFAVVPQHGQCAKTKKGRGRGLRPCVMNSGSLFCSWFVIEAIP